MTFSCECGQLTDPWAEKECTDCGHFAYEHVFDDYERNLMQKEIEKKKNELREYERKRSESIKKISPIRNQEKIEMNVDISGYAGDDELEMSKRKLKSAVKKKRKQAKLKSNFLGVMDGYALYQSIEKRLSQIEHPEPWERYIIKIEELYKQVQ